MGFTDFVGRYQLARSEGLVLRYLTDAYRTLRQTVPEAHRPPELEDLVEWLGETVRQTDSSLLDEWEALTDPEHVRADVAAPRAAAPAAADLAAGPRPFRVMIRNAMWRRVELVARDDLDGLIALERPPPTGATRRGEVVMTRSGGTRRSRTTTPSTTGSCSTRDARGPALLAGRGRPAGRWTGPRRRSTTPRATTTG